MSVIVVMSGGCSLSENRQRMMSETGDVQGCDQVWTAMCSPFDRAWWKMAWLLRIPAREPEYQRHVPVPSFNF